MTIPLERLREFPQATPEIGRISIAIARHQAETWPSPEVHQYARDRTRLIHQLGDELNMDTQPWEDIDAPHPREVVEIIVPLAAAIVPVLGNILVDWLKERPQKNKPSVPGIKIKRPDGAYLELTYDDVQNYPEIAKIATKFLEDAVDDNSHSF